MSSGRSRKARHPDGHCAKPVIQVFSKFAGLCKLQQFAVGGGNYPHIGFLHFRRSNSYKLTGFQHPQQTCLGANGHFADFIQENGAAVNGFKIAFAAVYRTCKRAFLVPKKFGVDSAFGNGAAVYGNKWVVFARRKACMIDENASFPTPLSPTISTLKSVAEPVRPHLMHDSAPGCYQ